MTLDLFPESKTSPLIFEDQARRRGFATIAGIDEVGRGPLAGPVVAAAVILPPNCLIDGLTDSKRLSAPARVRLFAEIRRQAWAIGLGMASPEEIDRINILQGTLQAMSQAVGRLKLAPDYLLVDGITAVPLALPQKTLKKGDLRSHSIAAASVIAKVVRDRMMTGYDRHFPGYGFSSHKGYGSAAHMEAIARLGPSVLHRRTFRGVREHCGS